MRRAAIARICLGAALAAGGAGGARTAGAASPIAVEPAGAVEKGSVELPGVVISAWSPGHGGGEPALFFLVRPPREAEGARSLLRLTLAPEPRLETVASGLAGWMETLAAIDLGGGPELVAGGEGRIAALGAALESDGTASSRMLAEGTGVELRTLSPDLLQLGISERFVGVEPGRVEILESDGAGGLRALPPVSIPFSVRRSAGGLARSSPRLSAEIGPHSAQGAAALFVGPEAVGHLRVRGSWIDLANPAAPRPELWAALPGPEEVEQSWPARLGSAPILIVRTQAADEMNLFEAQRLRVLPLAADRTRAGAKPTLAVELDSKRWHRTEVALADVDADGGDDLVALFPEGLGGSDLVAQWWRGLGEGRFEGKARRSDVEDAGEAWRLVVPAAGAGGARPAVLFERKGALELRSFAATGRSALAERPELSAEIDPGEAKGKKRTTVTAGTGEETIDVDSEPGDLQLLGAVDLDGREGLEALALRPSAEGRTGDRLVYLRRAPPAGVPPP